LGRDILAKIGPIPGFRTAAQAHENAGAMAFSPLAAQQIQKIDRLRER
jgi:aryl-alcohol dehydrogenase-like predicted oxidoreductase